MTQGPLTAEDVGAALLQISDQTPIDDAGVLTTLRAHINAWAASRPGHGLQELGDQIEIGSVTELASFKVDVEMQLERRSLIRRVVPDAAKELPKATVDTGLDLWLQDFDTPAFGERTSLSCIHEGSEQVGECMHCKGATEVTCNTCKGLTLVPGKAS